MHAHTMVSALKDRMERTLLGVRGSEAERLEGIEETLSLGSRQAKEQSAGHLHKLGSQSPSAPQSSRPFLHATSTLPHSCTGCLPTRHRAL